MINENVFCNIPYSSVVINPDGSYRLCSLTNGAKYDMGGCLDSSTGVEMNIYTHSFEEAINGKWQKHLRGCHSRGEKSSMCECCYNRDEIGGDSRRKHLLKYIPSLSADFINRETAPSQTNESFEFSGKVTSLDLRFGNLCNLACVTCGPWYSNKWYEDYVAVTNKTDFYWNGKTIDIKDSKRLSNLSGGLEPWWESTIWWERFDKASPDLRHLYVTAGEPLLVKAFTTMLERLVSKGYAKNVIIELDTNLTVLNPKTMDLWKYFKRVDLRVSVDELDDQYSLFRYPGKFSTLDDNLKELISRNYSNLDLLLTTCITPLNVFSINKIEEYSKSLGVKRDAHFRFVDSPGHLDIKKLSKSKKDFIIHRLKRYPGSKWSKKVIHYLEIHENEYNQEYEEKLVPIFEKLDSLRGTDWKRLFPEAAEMFKEATLCLS